MASFITFFFFLSLSSLLTQTQSSIDVCPLSFCCNSCMSINFSNKSTSVCFPDHCPLVTFPFHLKHSQNQRCGYNTSFELSCNNQKQTILNLPSLGGDFIVKEIDYWNRTLSLRDPHGCFVRRLLNSTYNHDFFSPFRALEKKRFTFLNCSAEIAMAEVPNLYPVPCLSGGNHTILRVEEEHYNSSLSRCEKIGTVATPVMLAFGGELHDVDEFSLGWDVPNCKECVRCGLKRGSQTEIECMAFGPPPTGAPPGPGLPRSAKYGIIIGVGIPALLCFIGLGCFIYNKIYYYAQRRRRQHDAVAVFSIPITLQPCVVEMGLGRPTIESYPKAELGKSCRLPKPNVTTCSICLTDYQPSETIRTIPDCGHYFHVDCIDEWLMMKGTCPLCRNSLEDSTSTPFSPPLSWSPLQVSSR